MRPLPKPTYSVRRFLCADRKSDCFKSTKLSSNVDAKVLGDFKEIDDPQESPEVLKDDGKLIKHMIVLCNAHLQIFYLWNTRQNPQEKVLVSTFLYICIYKHHCTLLRLW